jgi:long-chain acyl-CoA synthetase
VPSTPTAGCTPATSGPIDKKGKLTLVGRSKDVIVAANGENIYPDDVERALGEVDG